MEQYIFIAIFYVLFCLIFYFTFYKIYFQTNPAKYKSIFNGFSVTVKEDGMRGLGKGWAPTAIGYSLQGLGKFGFYEIFKNLYSNMLGEVWFMISLMYLFFVFPLH